MAGYHIYSLDWDRFRQVVEHPTPKQLKALAKLLRDSLEDQADEFDAADPVLSWPDDLKSLAQIVRERLALSDWYSDLSTAGKHVWEGVIASAFMDHKDIDANFRVDSNGVYWDVIEIACKHHGIVLGMISSVVLSGFGARPYRYVTVPDTGISREEYDRRQADWKAVDSALSEAFEQAEAQAEKLPQKPQTKEPESDGKQPGAQELYDIFKNFDAEAFGRQVGKVFDTPGFAKVEKLTEKLSGPDDDVDVWSPTHSMHTPDEVQQLRSELQAAGPAIEATKNKEMQRQYDQELMSALDKIVADGRMLFIHVDT